MTYFQEHDACIPAQHHPALALTFASNRDFKLAAVIKDSGLHDADMPHAEHRLSATQYAQLLSNLANLAANGVNNDCSFMLGQQMLPGHYGAASQALLHATSLRHALDIMVRCAHTICPLLSPRWRQEGSTIVVYWLDAFGLTRLRGFLVEMHMAALVSMCRWLSGRRLPWTFCFNRTAPRYSEQHQIHLGSQLRFSCQFDAMLLDEAYLDLAWPRGNAMAAEIALQQQAQQAQQAQGILACLYDFLLTNIRLAPSLENSAQYFDISPATFKRHLARHGSHYQAELDQVRTHVALHLFHTQGLSNEAVADYLGFHDANNFRRSFKRWTGMTPMVLRRALI